MFALIVPSIGDKICVAPPNPKPVAKASPLLPSEEGKEANFAPSIEASVRKTPTLEAKLGPLVALKPFIAKYVDKGKPLFAAAAVA